MVASCVQLVAAALELCERSVDPRHLSRSEDHIAKAIGARTRELLRDPFLTFGEHTHAEELRSDNPVVRAAVFTYAHEDQRWRQRHRRKPRGREAYEPVRRLRGDDCNPAREV